MLLLAFGCQDPSPDVGGFNPALVEDGRLVEILMEADETAARDPTMAARNIRQAVIPRARANYEALGNVVVQHPRARTFKQRLSHVLSDRISTSEQYALALETHDNPGLIAALRRQRELDQSMEQLERDLKAARDARGTRGCSTAPLRP
jgi:hypothetical protein